MICGYFCGFHQNFSQLQYFYSPCCLSDIIPKFRHCTGRSRSRISSPTHRQNDDSEVETRDSSTSVRHEDDMAPRRRSSVSLLIPRGLISNRTIGMTVTD